MAAKERGEEAKMSETDAAAIRAREPSQLAEEAAEPAPTLKSALAGEVSGRHPWRRVLPYIGAQIFGMLLGAAVLSLFWWPTIRAFARDNGLTIGQAGSEKIAAIFSPYSPHPGFVGVDKFPLQIGFWQGFAVEFFATALLLIVILSLLESRSVNEPAQLAEEGGSIQVGQARG
jgi:glycerol uptake facilitator-like aquaporin